MNTKVKEPTIKAEVFFFPSSFKANTGRYRQYLR